MEGAVERKSIFRCLLAGIVGMLLVRKRREERSIQHGCPSSSLIVYYGIVRATRWSPIHAIIGFCPLRSDLGATMVLKLFLFIIYSWSSRPDPNLDKTLHPLWRLWTTRGFVNWLRSIQKARSFYVVRLQSILHRGLRWTPPTTSLNDHLIFGRSLRRGI